MAPMLLSEKDRVTVIMVTHSPVAAAYGGLHFHLKQGRIAENAPFVREVSNREVPAMKEGAVEITNMSSLGGPQ